MGTFHTRVGVGNPANREFQWVDALVDTGATYSMMPASLLDQLLHLSPTRDVVFTLADGSGQRHGVGEARFKIEDQEQTSPVIFGPEDIYLLGATSLQTFGLIADTSNHRLIPAPRLTL
jgi:predicted aspartyl protease